MTDDALREELETQVEEQTPPVVADDRASADLNEESAPETGSFEVNGERYTVDEIEPYVRTMRWATEHPDRWAQIQEWERNGYVLPEQVQQAVQQQVEDDEDEWVDPRVRDLEQRYAALEQQMYERQDREDRAAVDLGWDAFLTNYTDLSEEDRNQVLLTARDWQLVAAAVERESNPARVPQAVQQAFENAYRMTFYGRAGQQAADRAVTNISRARRAAAPNAARPTSRTRPEPKVETARDLENALREQMTEAFEANR